MPVILGDFFLGVVDPGDDEVEVFDFPMKLQPGFELSPRIALNTHKYFSHEVAFATMQENLRIGEGADAEKTRVRVRQVAYNFHAHLKPKGSWFRPYLAVGPSLTSFRFDDVKLRRRAGAFRFAVRNVGAIRNAFNSSGVAPLDGGTIFRLGLNYGAGAKIRLFRTLNFRLEYRETFSKDPD